MKKLIIFCLLLFACTPETRKEFAPTPDEEANRIRYYKDNRTGLCFASSEVSEYPIGTAEVFTNVPCTPEVEKLLNDGR